MCAFRKVLLYNAWRAPLTPMGKHEHQKTGMDSGAGGVQGPAWGTLVGGDSLVGPVQGTVGVCVWDEAFAGTSPSLECEAWSQLEVR